MTQIIPFEQAKVPAKLASLFPLEKLGGVSGGFPIISIKGKIFTRVAGEEREMIKKPGEDDPASSIDVVILKQNPALSKVYYKGSYSEGSDEKPLCYSNNGISPELDSEEPQASKCSVCPHNVWGSRITENGGKGKACADSRRIAVAALGLINDPMLIRVPAASLKVIDQYGDSLLKRQVPYQLVVTRIGFDYSVAHPALTFKPIGMVDEATADQIAEQLNEPVIDRILGFTPSVVAQAQIAEAPAEEKVEAKAETKAAKPKVEKPAEPTPEELAAKAKADKLAKLKAEMEALENGEDTPAETPVAEAEAVPEVNETKPLKTKAAAAVVVDVPGDLATEIGEALDGLNFDDAAE
jgi:hypothetical protein